MPRSPKVEGDHGSYGRQPDDHGECLRGGYLSKNNFRHLTLEPMRDYQADVNDDETAKDYQPDEVETARRLPAAKDSGKSREPRTQRRRHHDSGNNLKRRENENNETVGELLDRIERISLGRQSKMEVGQGGLPRRREDGPGRWHKASPLRRREKQDDVNQSSQKPAVHRPEVPVTPQT